MRDGNDATLRYARPHAASKMQWLQLVRAWPRSPRQHEREIKAAAAGCGLLQLVSGHSPSADMCLPVTVLEKVFTIQTLAALLALAAAPITGR